MKSFLQHLLVIQAFIAFNVLAPVAQAKSNPFAKEWVQDFNYSWTLENSVAHLKTGFKSDEDHVQIDKIYNQLKDEKKDWHLEWVPEGVAFVQNGKKQFIFNERDDNTITINGKKISFKNTSFEKFKNDFKQAIQSKDYSLQSLFIEEAHAILPFLIGAVVLGGVAIAATSASAKGRRNCQVPQVDFAYTLAAGKFNGNMCPSNDMSRNYQRRLKLVSQQFGNNKKFSDRPGTSYKYSQSCVSKFSGIGQSGVIELCKCIYKKQQPCARRVSDSGQPRWGWNMKLPMAEQTCMTAWRYYKEPCQPDTPTVDTPSPTPTCGKTGNHCSPQQEPPILDTPVPDTHRPGKTDQ